MTPGRTHIYANPFAPKSGCGCGCGGSCGGRKLQGNGSTTIFSSQTPLASFLVTVDNQTLLKIAMAVAGGTLAGYVIGNLFTH